MSTDEFLKDLNYDQLQYAHQRCGELIAEKEKGQRQLVWKVQSEHWIVKYFQADEYLVAAEFLVTQARENAADQSRSGFPREMELELSHAYLRQSEWDELFPNNERGGV